MKYKLSEIVSIQPGFKAAVDILRDLENKNKIQGYIPTENGARVIEQVFDYLKPHTSTRPIILTGAYGTGKSHLGLVIATLLRKHQEDELCKSLSKKIENKWPGIAKKIRAAKENYGDTPYLFVYLEAEKVDWGSGFFNNSLILALKEALERENLKDIIPKTAYDRALARINEIEERYLDAYKNLETEVANKGYFSVEDIKRKLQKQDKKSLEDFANIHKKVCFGAEFDWYSGVSASDAYTVTLESLKEKGYKGILLIWDEFTPVLRKLIEDPLSGEALGFQGFAQTCESAGVNKIISLFISIRDIQEIIDRVIIESSRGESFRKDAEKISGRFRVMRLGHIDRETYYLMRGVISRGEVFKNIIETHNEQFLYLNNQVDELNLFNEYSLSKDDKRVIVEDLYPLHPVTTLVLSRLTDRVGQRERTIFTFLCDSGEGTFRNLLEKKEITETTLPFIQPFELRVYFSPLVRQSLDYKELKRLSRKYEETFASLPPDDEIGRKIIDTIFILSAVNVPSTTEHLLFSLGCVKEKDRELIKDKLEELKSNKKITQRLSDKSWRFFGQTLDVAMNDHIKEVENEISLKYSVKELFNDALTKISVKEVYRSIKAENYNIDRSIDRRINLEFIVTRELDNPESLRKKIEERYLDGAYYFVLSDTEEGLFTAIRRIKELFREDKNILFALPRNIFYLQEIIPHLRRLKALEELPERYPQYKSELRDELVSEEDDKKQFLKSRLDELLDPSKEYIEFYYEGTKREIKAVNKLRELVSEMMKKTFPYTPSIAREELIKEEGSDTWRTRYRIPLINTVLSPKAPPLLIQETDAVKKRIIEVIYKYHNILQRKGSDWIIGKPKSSPEDNAMIRIWEEAENFIKSASAPKEFPQLIKVLRLPPYGLKRRSIGLILAAVIRKYVLHNNLILEWKGQPIEKIDGELIEERVISKEQQIKVRFQEITEKHKVIWSVVAEIFGSQTSDLESVYRTTVNWWRELPRFSRNTNNLSDRAKSMKREFFEPLSAQEEDRTLLFNESLPKLVGIEDLSRKTDQEISEITQKELQQIKEEFENVLGQLYDDIKQTVLEVFKGEQNLLSYHSSLSEDSKRHIFTGDAKKLMDWLKEISSKKSANPNDYISLANNILGDCKNWNDEQISVLKGYIESAKNQIDSYLPVLPPVNPGGERPPLPEGKEVFQIGDISRVFTLYKDLNKAPNKEQVSILMSILKGGLLSALRNGQITGDEFLSIIYHLIKEFEND